MREELLEATDFDLLHASRSRKDAFAVFYRRYERLVAGWLVRRTRDPELAADLTAEVTWVARSMSMTSLTPAALPSYSGSATPTP